MSRRNSSGPTMFDVNLVAFIADAAACEARRLRLPGRFFQQDVLVRGSDHAKLRVNFWLRLS
jgi:hypothetical protein